MLAGISNSATDYEKVKYVFDTLVTNTEYNLSASDNQNIVSVYVTGESVCQGYAKATQLLLNRLDIPATLVTGRIVGGDAHAWNLIFADDEWYYIDTTWGDASYQSDREDGSVTPNEIINYDYMCVTSEDIGRTHMDDGVVELPVCTAKADNYYVHEGLEFSEYDEAKVAAIINDAVIKGDKSATLHASDDEVYNKMISELLDNQSIFKYLPGGGNKVRYSSNPQSRSITFLL